MKQYADYCILNYSSFLSRPIIGDFIYNIQILLIRFKWYKIFFASCKKSSSRNYLFKLISQKYKLIYCSSFYLERSLRYFSGSDLILDLPFSKKINFNYKQELYNLMWSLVYCAYVTERTKSIIELILPSNFPVINDRK